MSSSKGDDKNRGTQAKPFKTLQAAIAAAGGKPVYACGEAFVEEVMVSGAVTIYGALDCTKGWAYTAGMKTTLAAPPDLVPLTLAGTGIEIADFEISSSDAITPGGSSIALIANSATATLTRVDLIAGNGADGAAGVTPSGAGTTGADAVMGGLDGCTGTTPIVAGGEPGQTTCGATETNGGLGGSGTNLNAGGPGGPGTPNGASNVGGSGQGASSCDPGGKGADGLASTMPGAGATGIGIISAAGYQGPLATPGQSAGNPGSGGGGGGGAKKCGNAFAGPAGGGGGAGGCGGQPGGAGKSAGSSIGLVSIGATLTLDTVTITTAVGGTGGAGADGQPGGQGGKGGAAGNGDANASACNGGKGGQGGRGGSGGGGLGGHSIGIAISGGAAPDQATVKITPGAAGAGGIGGDMDMTAGVVGGNGMSCKSLDFTNMNCVM